MSKKRNESVKQKGYRSVVIYFGYYGNYYFGVAEYF